MRRRASDQPSRMLPAFRDNKTGKVYPSGSIHTMNALPAHLRPHLDQDYETNRRIAVGFLESNTKKFYTRSDAAQKTGAPGETFVQASLKGQDLRDPNQIRRDYQDLFPRGGTERKMAADALREKRAWKAAGLNPRRAPAELRRWKAAGLARKSAGGEVEVSAYERDGHPVSSYTRRKPTKE